MKVKVKHGIKSNEKNLGDENHEERERSKNEHENPEKIRDIGSDMERN